MENTLHYTALALYSLFKKKLRENLKGTTLTTGQPKVLEYLYYNEGSLQKDIAKSCHIEPATITTLLYAMEKNDLIVRKNENGDRRSLYVYLTDKGKEIAKEIIEGFQKEDERALKNISESEKEQFFSTLEKIRRNLEEDE